MNQRNVLFVCSANQRRSKTAEDYFALEYAQHNYDSAGTNIKLCQKEGTNPITQASCDWADIILVMENRHRKAIQEQLGSAFNRKVKVLGIPDRYKYYEKELIDLIEQKALPLIENDHFC